jgi:hypothetical protein
MRSSSSSDVIISLTSFPARVKTCWPTIDSLLSQNAPLKAVVLTLSEQEFPGRRLPKTLRRRVARGLTIEWIDVNRYSFDKLLPALERYPEVRIITVDDDKIYPSDMASRLIAVSDDAPGAVIGYSGRMMSVDPSGRFVQGDLIRQLTDTSAVYLLGGTGVLYPPGSLHADVHDYGLVRQLCPTHDDVWFWAMTVRSGAARICLGQRKPSPNTEQAGTPTLDSINETRGDPQLQAVAQHFDLKSLLDLNVSAPGVPRSPDAGG